MPERILTLLLVALACSAQARGQQASQPAPAPAPGPSDSYVTEKGFRSRVFEVRHRDPRSLASVLSPLGSGFKGAVIRSNEDFRTLTVRDFPENLIVIEEALKRLDVPQPLRTGIELRIHVLIASTAEDPASGDLPAELKDVLRQLQPTLNYRSYYLATSLVQRTKEGAGHVRGVGLINTRLYADEARNQSQYIYDIEGVSIRDAGAGARMVQMGRFRFQLPGLVEVATPADVRDGEKAVVGTASLRDKALILVVSAKTL